MLKLNNIEVSSSTFCPPLQTALALAVSLSKADMVRHLLREMQKQKTVSRSVNTYSVDKASRRETALITAARWDSPGAVL